MERRVIYCDVIRSRADPDPDLHTYPEAMEFDNVTLPLSASRPSSQRHSSMPTFLPSSNS
jgi:hypothetical protein